MYLGREISCTWDLVRVVAKVKMREKKTYTKKNYNFLKGQLDQNVHFDCK
jgi:hypothetical protein